MNSKRRQTIVLGALCVAVSLVMALGAAAWAQGAAKPEAEAPPSVDTMDEAGLINLLSSDADWGQKQTACRRLRQIGTAQSVPVLASLLPDEKLSHLARYALEPMPFPQVDQALRDVLATTQGLPRMGVIISIGVRCDVHATPLLIPLLNDADSNVACAAAGALGRIATPETAEALLAFRSDAPDAVQSALAEGLLAAGLGLTEKGDGANATKVYEELLVPGWPDYVRSGAFYGLAYAQPEQTPARLVQALSSDDVLFRGMAAQIIAETSGEDMTKHYAATLPKLPVDGQVALLRGLADRNDPAAQPAVVQAVSSPDKAVKLAAAKALGTLGNRAEDVATLIGVLATDDVEILEAVKVSLIGMQGDAVAPAIAAGFSGAAAPVRVQLLEVLAIRRIDQAMPLAVQSLADPDAAVRVAALDAIGLAGGTTEAPAVVAVVVKTTDGSERAAAEKALGEICSRKGGEVLPVVRDAMAGAGPEAQAVLLRSLARIGGTEALTVVVASVEAANEDVSNEALRVLSNWETLDAAPHLGELAQSDDLKRQVLGLRGYVRLARTEKHTGKKAEMLTNAMAWAKRPEEKKLVVAAWGAHISRKSLDALSPLLDDPAVRNEAASAIVAVATQLGQKGEERKAEAVEALKAVLEKCEDAGIRENTQKVLTGFGA